MLCRGNARSDNGSSRIGEVRCQPLKAAVGEDYVRVNEGDQFRPYVMHAGVAGSGRAAADGMAEQLRVKARRNLPNCIWFR
jgi:hypothetical protein